MSKKRFSLSIVLLFIIIVTGCNGVTQQPDSSVPAPSVKVDNSKKDGSLSYTQYRDLFADMSQKLQLEPFNFLESTQGSNVVAIDKDWSFGARTMLTRDGKPTDEETQERIIYKNKDDTLLLIDLIYLKDTLSNDLVLWPTHETEAYQKEAVLQSFDEAMLTYKNVIVKITLITKEPKAELSDMQSVLKSVTSFIKKVLIS
ncbi:hypothetical protein [Paenibacillus terrae]|uniref:hypothetical protein n=1 Tax=Paenibacillus terrae TaxID=159743 RepID=UPI0011EB1EA3|nr:hypothetical protein [Paenibacillus terrae]